MKARRARRAVAVLAAVCGAGLGSTHAAAATQPVAWGTTSSAPAGALGELFGVAAASSSDVLAVGGFNPGQPPTAVLIKPYAEHWTGAAWSATTVPLGSVFPSGEQAAQLNGVTEAAAGDGWAVGTVSDLSSLASRTLAYHWDGTAWTRFPTPDPAGQSLPNQLNAVVARATNDVWAAGYDNYPSEASLVLHWNGTAWHQVSVPNIGALDAVAVAPGRVWVAGGNRVAVFNGTAWTKLPAPPVASQDSVFITGLAHNAAGLWAVGNQEFSCGEGGVCTASYAALWNGTAWTQLPGAGGTGLTGVAAAGSKVLATSAGQVFGLSLTGGDTEVTPAPGALQLQAIAADPAGNTWAAGQNGTQPGIINAPGIGQGGIAVTTGASGATVTWAGPVTGSGGTDVSGRFAVGGLPDGSYTVTASLAGCQPGVATATVTAGQVTAVNAPITCPP
jgi:carboxypeptidase family protein